MKKLTLLLGFLMCLTADVALANAEAASVTGTAQVASGSAPARPLRQGDIVRQGDTVSTGAGSAVVLRFDDGQIAALSANTRMTVNTYTFNPQTESGNILLSLVNGGMRAVTGLIGKREPKQVAFKAATATIGIRGTDTSIAVEDGELYAEVEEGAIDLTYNPTERVNAGQAARLTARLQFSRDTRDRILAQVSERLRAHRLALQNLLAEIRRAQQLRGRTGQRGTGTTTPSPAGPQGTAGGGTQSVR